MAVNEQDVYAKVSRRTGTPIHQVQRVVEVYGDEWVRAEKADQLANTPIPDQLPVAPSAPRKRNGTKAKAVTPEPNAKAAEASTEGS